MSVWKLTERDEFYIACLAIVLTACVRVHPKEMLILGFALAINNQDVLHKLLRPSHNTQQNNDDIVRVATENEILTHVADARIENTLTQKRENTLQEKSGANDRTDDADVSSKQINRIFEQSARTLHPSHCVMGRHIDSKRSEHTDVTQRKDEYLR